MPVAPTYRKTGYPLPVESTVDSSTPWVKQLGDICLRTLQNCMLETYMDCPYYEQLQFIMDTRLQMLFTYAVSYDTQLAQKALLDFHCGMRPEGLLPGKTPTAYCQVISTFSLHYVYALWEYVAHTGDLALARRYRPAIDPILDYYDSKRDETGLVGKIGPWAFMDWQDDWKASSGVSPAYFEGPSTIINLMYAWALACGAKLCEGTGRPRTALEYRQRREEILEKIQALCFDEAAEMLREGPNCRQFTRHAQAWAVINGLFTPAQSRTALKNALACPPCSFSTSYEWFRALEQAGMEGEMRQSLDAWIGLIDRGNTTCPEEPHHPRSECHAWSALPLYEMMRTMAGVHPEAHQIVIKPHLYDLSDLSGTAITPSGPVHYCYQKCADGQWRYEVRLPGHTEGLFTAIGAVGTILSSLLCVRIVNRLGTGRTVLYSLLMAVAGLIGYLAAPSPYVICAANLLIGSSAGCLVATLNAYLSLHYKARHLNWVHCFWGIGSMVGPALLTLSFQAHHTWRGGYVLAACCVGLIFVSFAFTLPRWKTSHPFSENTETSAAKRFVSNGEALRMTGVKTILLLFLSYYAAESCITLWITSFVGKSTRCPRARQYSCPASSFWVLPWDVAFPVLSICGSTTSRWCGSVLSLC